jgi:hypothetical protein
LAERLAKEYKHMYYTCPSWVDAYPKMNKPYIGFGLEGVEVVESPWEIFSEVDLWIFPDTYYGPLQEFLISQGEIVWGSRNGEELELQRDALKEHMAKLKLPVSPWKSIMGIDDLKKYLEENDNVFVKINKWRGTVETFYSENYQLIKPELDEIEHELGSFGSQIEFVVETPVKDAIEVGYDGWNIDGQYPSSSLFGVEIKDKAYAGMITPYKDLSPLITDFNQAMTKTFESYGYRGFFSTEIRIDKKKTPYMIDFTARCPCPPGDIYGNIFENLGEIIWEGANGNLVDPVATAKYGVELLIESDWAIKNFQPLYFDKKYADNIHLKKHMIMDDIHYIIPQSYGSNDIGGIVGTGATLQEALDQALEVADAIKGNGICIRKDTLDCAEEELNKFEEVYGTSKKN